MNRAISLSNPVKLNVGGLALAALGMLLEMVAGSVLYPTLTGPIVLLVGAALVAYRPGGWTSYLGLILPLVLAAGLAVSAVLSPAFFEQFRDIGNVGIVAGSMFHVVGLIAAIGGGVAVLRFKGPLSGAHEPSL